MNIKKKKICVLMAAYNGEKWIHKQIMSILNQKSVLIDIFINLDLSTDNTLKVILDLKKKYKNINLIYTKKKFGNSAQNFFYLILNVNFNKYDYISLSDQDDIWFANKLHNAIKILNKKCYSGYSSNVLLYKNSKISSIINKSQKQKKFDYFFEGGGPGCTMVIPKAAALDIKQNIIKNSNIIKKLLFHDWYIYFFIRAQNKKWFIDKNPSLLYRQHESNELGANIGLKATLKRLKFIFSGNLLNQILFMCKCCLKNIDNVCKKNLLMKKKSIIFFIKNFTEFRRKKIEQFIFLFLIIILRLFGRI